MMYTVKWLDGDFGSRLAITDEPTTVWKLAHMLNSNKKPFRVYTADGFPLTAERMGFRDLDYWQDNAGQERGRERSLDYDDNKASCR